MSENKSSFSLLHPDIQRWVYREKWSELRPSQVEAIKNLQIDKITVWDGGGNGEGSSTSNFVSSLVKSLPPIHDVAKMAGVELPQYLGKVSETDETN